jgi:hypothetical protein
MTERGQQLHTTADGQIAGLIDLIATIDETRLRLPCPGREKLGDGTVGASVRHTAANYQRIAGFVQTSDREHGPDAGRHDATYSADSIDLERLVEQLSASRETLGRIAELTDSQLDAIPAKDSFRFCDGQRTLEQGGRPLCPRRGQPEAETVVAMIESLQSAQTS